MGTRDETRGSTQTTEQWRQLVKELEGENAALRDEALQARTAWLEARAEGEGLKAEVGRERNALRAREPEGEVRRLLAELSAHQCAAAALAQQRDALLACVAELEAKVALQADDARKWADIHVEHSIAWNAQVNDWMDEAKAAAAAVMHEAAAAVADALKKKADRMATIGGPEEEEGATPDWFAGYWRAVTDYADAVRALPLPGARAEMSAELLAGYANIRALFKIRYCPPDEPNVVDAGQGGGQ